MRTCILTMRTWILFLALPVLLAWTPLTFLTPSVGFAASATEQQQLEFFENKIRPILVQHCYQCHSAESDTVQGGLRLDSREAVRAGGDSGPAVVPGDLQRSLLLDAIRYESYEMPPDGKLPDHVIEDFQRWIEMGAADPRDGDAAPIDQGIDYEQGREFWSLQPLEKPPVPEVRDSQWPAGDIDRFILARLEADDLTPRADADRRTLLRRLYFDLVGMPPTPEQIQAFLDDPSPRAVETVIDQLLASPHFGQRWGRHWLDSARYAESTGERGRIYPEAWRYRDYVINAFNEDRPYDRFLREQIAGDLLDADDYRQRQEQLTATGYLALGPVTFELQDKVQLEWDMIDDQVDTLGRSVLGLTLGCARCHDHMTDPIATEDYYALAGIFSSTHSLDHGNISDWIEHELPISPEHEQALTDHRRVVAELEKKVAQMRQELEALQGRPSAGPWSVEALDGIVVDHVDAEKKGQWHHSTYHPNYVGDGYLHDNQEGRGTTSIRFVAQLPEADQYEVRISYTSGGSRAPNVPVTIAHAGGEETIPVSQQEEPPIDGLFKPVGRFAFNAGETWVRIGTEGTTGHHVIADAVQFVSVQEIESGPPVELAARIEEKNVQLEELQAQLEQLQEQAPPPRPRAMGVREADQIQDVAVRVRGNAHRKGNMVPRGFLSVLKNGDEPVIGDGTSGRLELARWLTRPDHPLTARVFVNRVWHHLFGHGLVRTVDNFGVTGEEPSHPELLDWLAVRFVEEGWSVKWLIAQITQSRVYQLSTANDPIAARADPENRLLWRANRRRLEVEPLRDAMLAVSGELDLAAGGRVIRPGTSEEYGYEYRKLRRSVYVPVFRIELYEMFELFDFPPPTMVVGQRATTTLPTQALFLMNSPWVIDRSRAAAQRLLDEHPDLDDSARVDLAYERALGRLPTAEQRRLAVEFLDQQLPSSDKGDPEAHLEAWAQVWQVLFASIDFRYIE